mmetsp:Transcript_51997/g.114053  ORF Transcript_51997/g.114053 Transcript_51997/m.114053 type:complete len:223 (+) Transcript_51997:40-708(+)
MLHDNFRSTRPSRQRQVAGVHFANPAGYPSLQHTLRSSGNALTGLGGRPEMHLPRVRLRMERDNVLLEHWQPKNRQRSKIRVPVGWHHCRQASRHMGCRGLSRHLQDALSDFVGGDLTLHVDHVHTWGKAQQLRSGRTINGELKVREGLDPFAMLPNFVLLDLLHDGKHGGPRQHQYASARIHDGSATIPVTTDSLITHLDACQPDPPVHITDHVGLHRFSR